MSVKVTVDVERITKVHVEVDVPDSQLIEAAKQIGQQVVEALLEDHSERST